MYRNNDFIYEATSKTIQSRAFQKTGLKYYFLISEIQISLNA